MANRQSAKGRKGLWRRADSSSSSYASTSSDCETLSDASTKADPDHSNAAPPSLPSATNFNAQSLFGFSDHNRVDFKGALALLPCYVSPSLTGCYCSKDRCRICVKHKRHVVVYESLRAHQLLDAIELSLRWLGPEDSGLLAALSQFLGRAVRSKETSPRNGVASHDWNSLHAALHTLQCHSLLDCSGQLLQDRIRSLIAGHGSDSREDWFLASAMACIERLQARLRLLFCAPSAASEDSPTRQDPPLQNPGGLGAYICSNRYKKSLAAKQAKALTQCSKLAAATSAVIDGVPSALDVELSCLERALLVSANPTLVVDVSSGPCSVGQPWLIFSQRVSRYTPKRLDIDAASLADPESDDAYLPLLSKLKHLVILGIRGDVNHFLHQLAPLTSGVVGLCMVDTSWLYCTDPHCITSLWQEQIHGMRWTMPPNVVQLRALRESIELEFAIDDRQKDLIQVFSVHGSRITDRSLLHHPEVANTEGEKTYPSCQRFLQVKLHERIRLNASISAAIQGRPRYTKVGRHGDQGLVGENAKGWARLVSLYDERFGVEEPTPQRSIFAELDGRAVERAETAAVARPRDRLTVMCLRVICDSITDELDDSVLESVPPHLHWALAASYRCVSCQRIVLPPMKPLKSNGSDAGDAEPDLADGIEAFAWNGHGHGDSDDVSDSDGNCIDDGNGDDDSDSDDDDDDFGPPLPTEPQDVYTPRGMEGILSDPSLLEIDLEVSGEDLETCLLWMGYAGASPAMQRSMLARARFAQKVWHDMLDAGFLPPIREEVRLLRARRGSDDDDELVDTWTALKTGLAPQHYYTSDQIDVHTLIGASNPTAAQQDNMWQRCQATSTFGSDSSRSDDGDASSDHLDQQPSDPRSFRPESPTLAWRFCLECFRSHMLITKPGTGPRARLNRKLVTTQRLQEELAEMEATVAAQTGTRCHCVVCRQERDGSHYSKAGVGCWIRTRWF
ncbi:hypothetical protein ACQY0O_000353 [Thecaphora frezii]